MLSQVRTWAIAAGAAILCASTASAQFSDNFESYPASAGGTLFTPGGATNSGGWHQWDHAVNNDTLCFGAGGPAGAAHSGTKYIGTQLASDCVREFTGFTSGHWDVDTWTYIPGPNSPSPAQDVQWFILLQDYNDFGPYVWATQVQLDPLIGTVNADNGISLISCAPQYGGGTTLTFDAWKKIQVDVDLATDTAVVSYDNTQIGDPFRWSQGPFGQNGGTGQPCPAPSFGTPAIDCIDLYAANTTIPLSFGFWDDVSIQPDGSAPTPTIYCTPGTTTSGCSPTIGFSGTPSASASSGFTISANNLEAQKNGLIFYAVTNVTFTPVQWGAGGTSFLCIKAPTQRMNPMLSSNVANCAASFSQDWNAFMAATPGALGNPRMAGASFDAQGWIRCPPCPKTTILTDALRFVLAP